MLLIQSTSWVIVDVLKCGNSNSVMESPISGYFMCEMESHIGSGCSSSDSKLVLIISSEVGILMEDIEGCFLRVCLLRSCFLVKVCGQVLHGKVLAFFRWIFV